MKRDVAKRVSSRTRANGLYSLELKKKGPRFSISKDKKKEGLKFRGSSNQRIIDVPNSLKTGDIITLDY